MIDDSELILATDNFSRHRRKTKSFTWMTIASIA